MSDKTVAVTEDNAVLLLEAAQSLGQDASVVRINGGRFVAPDEVYNKAFPPSGGSSKTASKKPAPGTEKE